jgi:hypothetical protein
MIDVMDNLAWFQRSSKHLFSNNSMFVLPAPSVINLDDAINGTSRVV